MINFQSKNKETFDYNQEDKMSVVLLCLHCGLIVTVNSIGVEKKPNEVRNLKFF